MKFATKFIIAFVVFIIVASLLASCGGGGGSQPVSSGYAESYCVDQNGTVVDPDYCDDDSGSYLFWYSTHGKNHHYKPGHRIPSKSFYAGHSTKASEYRKSTTPPAKANRSAERPKVSSSTSKSYTSKSSTTRSSSSSTSRSSSTGRK